MLPFVFTTARLLLAAAGIAGGAATAAQPSVLSQLETQNVSVLAGIETQNYNVLAGLETQNYNVLAGLETQNVNVLAGIEAQGSIFGPNFDRIDATGR